MEDDEKIREIVASFLKTPPSSINSNTPVGKKAVAGSIILHRMYSKLSDAGFPLNGSKRNIETYGQLLECLGSESGPLKPRLKTRAVETTKASSSFPSTIRSVGIDIEKVSQFERQEDYRSATFYKENFSPEEIAHCILQPNPIESFAGRFAAKEAIAKANNSFRDIPFNQISISADSNGKPSFPGFHISISHTESDAIAIAIQT
ncbi:4'-phosphopantetheinyl transferase superfamily protein [Pelagicoccus sp. SDUM812005]|uniref:holo-ACP synthase n=1 Tax=Pelagicoccus sp. SDUM812005 TaxID=3041257 RepID=UPI00280E3B5E|nr:4'-phosphopantetheinyl transferase superfamily protein [Pelagicoccus sp. SDUM812005]MDQ8180927.1 4'-phosphopantetheinyl transferase superfamily protein [Pelagicoccus sp. SDUM812005]